MENVVIDFQSQIKGITDANTALDNLGKTDKKNAEQFAKSNAEYQTNAQKRAANLKAEISLLADLEAKKKKAFDVQSIQAYNDDIRKSKENIRLLKGETDKLNGANGNLISSFKNIGAAIGIAFGAHQIIAFGKEAVSLALKAEEVKIAFNKLGGVDLADLRKAVNGTLTDLKLMQLAVQADTLKIPFQDLASIMEFAEKKAGALGRSTEDVAQSIIQGIGKGSTRTLKEFGLAVTELATDFDTTGKTSADAIKSIKEQLGSMEVGVESASDKVERLDATFTNWKTSVGEFLVSEGVGIIDFFEKLGSGGLIENINSVLEASFRTMTALVTGGLSEVFGAKLEDAKKNVLTQSKEFLIIQKTYQNATQEQRIEIIKKTESLDAEHRKALLDGFKQIEEGDQKKNDTILKQGSVHGGKVVKQNDDTLKKIKSDTDEFNKLIAQSDADWQETRLMLAKEFRDGLVELTKEELDTLLEQGQIPLDIYQETLDAMAEKNAKFYEEEKERLVKFNDEKKRVDAEYLEAKQNLIIEENDALIQGAEIAKNIFGEESGFAKAFLLFQKAVAIAQIVQQLQREKAANFLVASEKSVIVPVLSEAYYATAIAKNQAANIRAGIGIATIASQAIPAFKLAKGGKLDGKAHSEGGIPLYEAEGGEYVVNKKSTAKYDSILKLINEDKAPELMNAFVRLSNKDGKSGYMIKNEMDVFTLGKMYGNESNKVVAQLKTLNKKFDGSQSSKLLARREKW